MWLLQMFLLNIKNIKKTLDNKKKIEWRNSFTYSECIFINSILFFYEFIRFIMLLLQTF